MKKAMLSQPMAGKTDKEITETRNKAIKTLQDKGYEVVNTLFTDEWYSKERMSKRGVVQIPLCFLAKSLENMSLCHAVYFCKGWESARGCKIEHEAAKSYGLEIIYEVEEKEGNTNIETISTKEIVEIELARRELQRKRISKSLEKLNRNELNKLEIYLSNEI